MQTPEQIIPKFAPETRFDVETKSRDEQTGPPENSALGSFRNVIEIPVWRGVPFSALND